MRGQSLSRQLRRPRIEVDSPVNFTSGLHATRYPARVLRRPFSHARASFGEWRKPGSLIVGALFALIMIAGLWIRLRNNGYGLPFVYNYDEGEHFTNRAVEMFGGNFDPGYYQ